MFRNNNGVPEFSIDNGTTWQKIGGSSMKTKFGTGTSTTSGTTVDISDLNFTSADDYFVILDIRGTGGSMTAKTANSFSLSSSSNEFFSWQVVYFE